MTQIEYVIDAGANQHIIDGIPAGTAVTVELATVDAFSAVSAYVQATGAAATVGDTTAPATPTGMAAAGAILGAIISWTNNTEADLDHYDLAISTDGGSTYPTVYSSQTTVVALSQLTAATAYKFKVRAVDHTGNASAYCAAVTATPRTVQTADLTDALITTAKLVAGSVDATILAAASVTAANGALAANAVVLGKIATDAVDSAAIAASAVGNSELAAGAVTAAKITAGTITATQIAAGTITTNEIAALTIVAANIAAGTIVASKIAAGTITSNEIAAATIVAANIAAGTITGSNIAAGTIAAANIIAGTITSNEIAANTITAANILAGTITGTQIAALTITAAEMAAGSITASKLQSTLVLATTLVCGTVGAASVIINSTGIKSYDSSGNLEVSIPSDGSDVYINAQVDAKSLLVTGNAVFNGAVNEISEAATLVLDSSQTNPSLAPVVTAGFPATVSMPQDTAGVEPVTHNWLRMGLDYDSAGGAGGATKVFYTCSRSDDPTATSFNLLEIKASDRTVNRSLAIAFPGSKPNKDNLFTNLTVARMGSLLYVVSQVTYLDAHGQVAGTQVYVQTVTQSTFAAATLYTNMTGVQNAVQVITLTNNPTGAAFTLTYNDAISGDTTTVAFVKSVNMTAAAIQTALRTATGDSGLTVTGTTNTGPFTVTFADLLWHNLLHATPTAGVGTAVTTAATTTAWGDLYNYTAPVICSDGTNVWLINCSPNGDNHIRWNKYNSTMVKQGSTIDAGTSPGVAPLIDAAAGSFDLGALRIIVQDDDGLTTLSFDSAGTSKPNEVFPSTGMGGLTYGDALGTGARFWTISYVSGSGLSVSSYGLQPYTTWIQTAAASLKYYVGYTFYDGHTEQSGTAAASTDLVAVTAHGFVADTRVRFGTLTGGTGLLNTIDYFVLASGLTTNAFKVALTSGGAAIDITVDYSAITVGTTHETQISPRASITVQNRQQLNITPAAIPGAGGNNDPSAERYYIFPNASDPGIGGFKRQAEGTGVQALTTYNSSGIADPATNSFSTVGVPAQLNSGNTAQGFSIRGDGTFVLVGTTFPASPATNAHYWRSDLQQEFYYDGTRWLSTVIYSERLSSIVPNTATAVPTSITGTESPAGYAHTPELRGGSDIYLVSLNTHFFVNGGTALGASHNWVGTLNKRPTGNTDTLLVTVNINSGSSSVWREDLQAINALMNNGTIHYVFDYTWTKTGTPGPLFADQILTYRIVAT